MINLEKNRSQPKNDDIIAQIKSSINFKDFFSEKFPEVELKRTGVGSWIGSSPFREDKNPSLQVDKDHCFDHGTKEKLDVIDFYELVYKVNRETAIKDLSKKAGIISGNGNRPAKKQNSSQCKVTPISGKAKPQKYADLKDAPFNEKRYEQMKKESVASYLHKTPEGNPHIQVFRTNIAGKREFYPWTWNGEYYVLGCPEDTPRYLYGIERVKDADVVIVVEGEKDADNINELLGYDPKIIAVTWAGGAGALEGQCKKWDILGPLAGKDVYFIPDNDEPGETAFNHALKYLFGRVDELRRVKLPGLGEHGDASDFLELHKDEPNLRDLFIQTCMEAPLYLPDFEAIDILYRADLLTKLAPLRPPPEEVVKGIIPIGLTIIGGKKSARKSILCQQIALAVAKGCPALGYFETTQGTVIHASLEDDDYNWNDRLQKMLTGENGPEPAPNNLYATFLVNPMPLLEAQIETWKKQHPDLKLVFLDILAFILNQAQNAKLRGAASGGYHEWYQILPPLKNLAKRLGIAIVLAHHLNKKESDNPSDDFTGSNALTGAMDNYITIRKVFKKEYQGTLYWEGKRARDIKLKAMSFHPETMTLNIIGDVDSISLNQVEQDIINELEAEQKPVKLQDLKLQCGENMSPSAFKMAVKRLVDKGRIENCVRQGFYQAKTTGRVL